MTHTNATAAVGCLVLLCLATTTVARAAEPLSGNVLAAVSAGAQPVVPTQSMSASHGAHPVSRQAPGMTGNRGTGALTMEIRDLTGINLVVVNTGTASRVTGSVRANLSLAPPPN